MGPFARDEGCNSEHRELGCRYWMTERPMFATQPERAYEWLHPAAWVDVTRFLFSRNYRPRT